MTPQLHYYPLDSAVTAFSTTRSGGVSTGSFSSLNINAYCGDSPEHIAANREALAQELDILPSRLIVPHQVHGVESRRIGPHYFTLPLSARQNLREGVDAVMTDVCQVAVGVSTADCIPVLIYDTTHHAVAAIHAGWRGTLHHIVLHTIAEMRLQFSTQPENIKAVIGPGISKESFEVGDEVYEAFSEERFDMQRIATRMPRMHDNDIQSLKWHIDLKRCNRNDLLKAGVLTENIHDCAIDTYQECQTYFSARRLGIHSGRIYTGIVLRRQNGGL